MGLLLSVKVLGNAREVTPFLALIAGFNHL